MTPQEMHIGVELGVQKLDSNAYDTLLPEEIDYYLNKAIEKFVKNHFEPRKNRLGLGFEQSVKRIEDIRTLITTTQLDTSEVSQKLLSDIYIDKASLPSDNFLIVSVGFDIFYNSNSISFSVTNGKREPDGQLGTDYEQRRMSGKFVQHDDIYTVLQDPFNTPDFKSGVFTIDGGDIYSYSNDTFITDKIVLTYVKQPQKVSLNSNTASDLSDTVHEDIVDLAIQLIQRDLGLLNAPSGQ